MSQVVFNHVGLCVSDRARSRAFYEGALDFQFWWELDPPDEGTSQLLQLTPPVGLHATYLVRDGFVLELLDYSAFELEPWRARVMAEPGLTHMSLSVDDIGGALRRVTALGGSVINETVGDNAAMVRDPDGQLIELLGAGWRRVAATPWIDQASARPPTAKRRSFGHRDRIAPHLPPDRAQGSFHPREALEPQTSVVMRRLTPYLLLTVVVFGLGAGSGLGLSESPSQRVPG